MSPAKAKARSYRALLKARLRDTRVSAEARFLWCLIESYADTNGKNAFPSRETLAAISGHFVAWVDKYLKELRAAKWVQVEKQKTAKGWNNRYYLVNPENWGDPITPETWVRGSYENRSEGVATNNGVTGSYENRSTTGYQVTGDANISSSDNTTSEEDSPFRTDENDGAQNSAAS